MRALFLLLACSVVLPLTAHAADTGEQIATVVGLEGTATITHATGGSEAAALDSAIALNDIIETAAGTKATVQFIDGTEIVVSENTQLTADEFVFDPENTAANKADYSILRGTFLYTSGLVAKKENPDVHVNTPYGSIGIRGTQFWGGPIDGSYGVLVNDGEVTVKNASGVANLVKGTGTTLVSLRQGPSTVKPWGEDKIKRAVATITMRDPQAVRDRIARRAAMNERLVQIRKQRLLRGGDVSPNQPLRERLRQKRSGERQR